MANRHHKRPLPTVKSIDDILDALTVRPNCTQRQLFELDSPARQNALIKLGGAMISIRMANQGTIDRRTKILLTNFRNRFPSIVSSLPCPLPHTEYNTLQVPALLFNCNMLAMLAQDEESLSIPSALMQHNILSICLKNWILHQATHGSSEASSADLYFPHPIQSFNYIAQLLVAKYGEALMTIVVSNVGVADAANLVATLSNSPSFAGYTLAEVLSLASSMNDPPEFVRELVKRRVAFSVTEKLWRLVRLAGSQEVIAQGVLTTLTFVTETIMHKLKPQDDLISLVVELTRTRDLISLYAVGLYHLATYRFDFESLANFDPPQTHSYTLPVHKNPEDSESFIHHGAVMLMDNLLFWIGKACGSSPIIIRTHVRPMLLPVLDKFLEIENPKRDFAIKSWTKLINRCKDIEMRDGPVDFYGSVPHRGKQMGECGWYQCILGGGSLGVTQRSMFFDDNCGSVRYCTIECQKRDWYEGRHRLACGPLPMGP